MRDPRVLLDAVGRAAPSFRTYYDGLDRRRSAVDDALARVLAMDRPRLEAALEATGRDRVGARPSREHGPGRIAVPYPEPPTDRDAARAFAERVLRRPMAFVDGSQVEVSEDLDVPFGLVTVSGSHARPGTLLSRHEAAEAVTPDELDGWRDRGVWNPNRVVHFHRWRMEVEYLTSCMEAVPGTVAVLDGSLVHSFATELPAPLREAYADVLRRALEVSEQTRSPLVGYVDSSRARDLVEMVRLAAGVEPGGLTDSHVLQPHLRGLGDRTAAWWCDRADGSLDGHPDRVGFHHALLGPGGPCRLEYPAWMVEAGAHEVAHDVLLAQCLAFGGYPRAVDECHVKCSVGPDDAAAVRSAFLRLAQEQGLPVRSSWKARSKRRGVPV